MVRLEVVLPSHFLLTSFSLRPYVCNSNRCNLQLVSSKKYYRCFEKVCEENYDWCLACVKAKDEHKIAFPSHYIGMVFPSPFTKKKADYVSSNQGMRLFC